MVLRESPTEITLRCCQHIRTEQSAGSDERPRTRRAANEESSEWWVERDGRKRTNRDTEWLLARADTRDDDYAGRKMTEDIAIAL